MRILKVLIAACLCIALCGCAASAAPAEQISIVCTSFPCYDFARAVAGDAAQLRLLIKPGAEVHSYEPTPADVMAMAECELFICIGGESDAWAVDMLESFGKDAPQVLRLFDCVEEAEAVEHDHDHHDEAEYDEHIWTSPLNAMRMVEAVRDELCALYPENEALWQANAEAYCAEIGRIHAAFEDVVSNAERREMIFADRFPFIYFAREYGIEYYSAFASCSAESEPSAKTMMELIDRVVSDKIPVIYTIELSSGKTAKTIAAETSAQIRTFHSVQNLTEADFSAGETYVSLMERNVEALREGLN